MKKRMMLGFLFLSSVAFASVHETLPSWHWAYPLIENLQFCGVFTRLTHSARPWTRGDVAAGLIEIRENPEQSLPEFTDIDLKQLQRLEEEFREEIDFLSGRGPEPPITAGLRLQQDIDGGGGESVSTKGVYRLRLNVPVTKWLSVHNAMNFDQYEADNPLYIGKKWRNITAFTEQAYASARFGPLRIKAGRDFLRWGPGNSGTLLFSDVCRPMDHVLGSLDAGPFRFSFMSAVLDEMMIHGPDWDLTDSGLAGRFLSAHRLDLRLLSGRLWISVSEAIVYGGIGRSLNWVYVNPLMLYYGSQVNNRDYGNTLGTVELTAYPGGGFQVYGALLIDDIQVEKTGPGDLEPATTGWLLGTQWADPFRVDGLTLSAEFARVSNRTYKTVLPWEYVIFRNQPLGHPLGNDFDHWEIGAEKWFGASLVAGLGYFRTRKGEGSLYTPWDAPWLNYTVEQGYSEPWLSGTVETRQGAELTVQWIPSTRWGLEGSIQILRRENAGHAAGVQRDQTVWKIGGWVIWGKKISMNGG